MKFYSGVDNRKKEPNKGRILMIFAFIIGCMILSYSMLSEKKLIASMANGARELASDLLYARYLSIRDNTVTGIRFGMPTTKEYTIFKSDSCRWHSDVEIVDVVTPFKADDYLIGTTKGSLVFCYSPQRGAIYPAGAKNFKVVFFDQKDRKYSWAVDVKGREGFPQISRSK